MFSFFLNAVFSQHGMHGTARGALMWFAQHMNECPCIFPTSEPHLFREYITGHLFVLQGRAYLYVLPALYLWPPYKRPLSIFFLLSTIDLLASRHFWTLKVVKKEEMMLGYVHFLQDVRCMSTSLSEFPDGLWAISSSQTDESKAMRFFCSPFRAG